MRAVSLILRKDVRTLLRTPALLLVLLAYPVMIAALLGLVAGYANAKPRVALVDEDGLPAHIVVGHHDFNVEATIKEVSRNVTLVHLDPDEARRELADGKIVAAGFSLAENDHFAIVRYNTDGSLDTTFGGTGKVTTAVGVVDGAASVAIQTDGKIVAAGVSNDGTSYEFAVVRYSTCGVLTPPPPPTKLKVEGGHVLVGSPGQGIILRSPNGTTCLKIGIDNAGALMTTAVTCP